VRDVWAKTILANSMMRNTIKENSKIHALGVMSGTSLDGLDIAAVEFIYHNKKWSFELKAADTIKYSAEWEQTLSKASELNAEQLTSLDFKYGRFIGESVSTFIKKHNFDPALVASHGHTVFHQPEKGFTLQIGHGEGIAKECGIQTVNDFRSGDVALGGQGAPLVPIGDRLLFSDYDYCLNLGGFANISFEKNTLRLAFDVCPVNIVLNHYAQKNGLPFDKNGDLGRNGTLNTSLLNALNNLRYYKTPAPKSLGREWVEQAFFPVLETFTIPGSDKMRTLYEHISKQIAQIIKGKGEILVTGGGAHNGFLMEILRIKSSAKVIIPNQTIVDYKEAIIFAFLGVLRIHGINNCLASVTGAKNDSCGGVVHHP
jgi:anhydro-N-acetylmuramic acid kinase